MRDFRFRQQDSREWKGTMYGSGQGIQDGIQSVLRQLLSQEIQVLRRSRDEIGPVTVSGEPLQGIPPGEPTEFQLYQTKEIGGLKRR